MSSAKSKIAEYYANEAFDYISAGVNYIMPISLFSQVVHLKLSIK